MRREKTVFERKDTKGKKQKLSMRCLMQPIKKKIFKFFRIFQIELPVCHQGTQVKCLTNVFVGVTIVLLFCYYCFHANNSNSFFCCYTYYNVTRALLLVRTFGMMIRI